MILTGCAYRLGFKANCGVTADEAAATPVALAEGLATSEFRSNRLRAVDGCDANENSCPSNLRDTFVLTKDIRVEAA